MFYHPIPPWSPWNLPSAAARERPPPPGGRCGSRRREQRTGATMDFGDFHVIFMGDLMGFYSD